MYMTNISGKAIAKQLRQNKLRYQEKKEKEKRKQTPSPTIYLITTHNTKIL